MKPRVEWSGDTGAGPGKQTDDRRGLMPDALRIGVLGPLQVRDGAGHTVPIGGRQLRVLLILLALDAGRVAPVGSLGRTAVARRGTRPPRQRAAEMTSAAEGSGPPSSAAASLSGGART